jgi:hypothetical protein
LLYLKRINKMDSLLGLGLLTVDYNNDLVHALKQTLVSDTFATDNCFWDGSCPTEDALQTNPAADPSTGAAVDPAVDASTDTAVTTDTNEGTLPYIVVLLVDILASFV